MFFRSQIISRHKIFTVFTFALY